MSDDDKPKIPETLPDHYGMLLSVAGVPGCWTLNDLEDLEELEDGLTRVFAAICQDRRVQQLEKLQLRWILLGEAEKHAAELMEHFLFLVHECAPASIRDRIPIDTH